MREVSNQQEGTGSASAWVGRVGIASSIHQILQSPEVKKVPVFSFNLKNKNNSVSSL